MGNSNSFLQEQDTNEPTTQQTPQPVLNIINKYLQQL